MGICWLWHGGSGTSDQSTGVDLGVRIILDDGTGRVNGGRSSMDLKWVLQSSSRWMGGVEVIDPDHRPGLVGE